MADGLTTEAYKDEADQYCMRPSRKPTYSIVKEQFSLKPISTDGKDLDHELVMIYKEI